MNIIRIIFMERYDGMSFINRKRFMKTPQGTYMVARR